jgi:phosphatidylglycerol:prolipoprotein diacylglycerol transferase
MRQVLFRIGLAHPWGATLEGTQGLMEIGACWLWLTLLTGFVVFQLLRGNRESLRQTTTWLGWGAGLLILSFVGGRGGLPESLPVFGYGMMVLLGFLAALWFSCARAKAVGYSPELIMDSAFYILISGVAGGRLAYLIQYRHLVFPPGIGLGEAIFRAVNLSEGGLVLLGALVGGGLGVVGFFWSRRLSILEFADLLMPAVFIGVGFGRIGCLLNGCCFGDRCALPWAIYFPKGSVTWMILVERGFLSPDAAATLPLHPTQIYSSLDGFLLAGVTAIYYWYRRHPGDVLALGCLLYSITRFFIEFLRSDEMGQLGTGLTISQLYCLGIFTLGLALLLTGPLRGRPHVPGHLAPSSS